MRPVDVDLDPSVVARLQAGDRRALEECYRVLGGRVYRLCRGMLGQHPDAEDATQEVFLKLLERAHQYGGRARFSTWLHRIAINHCLARIERERLRRADPLEERVADQGATPIETAQTAEARGRVDDMLARIPPQQRAVLVLREIDGLAYADIAATLELPVGTVMSRLARARERLATVLSHSNGQQALPRSRSAQ